MTPTHEAHGLQYLSIKAEDEPREELLDKIRTCNALRFIGDALAAGESLGLYATIRPSLASCDLIRCVTTAAGQDPPVERPALHRRCARSRYKQTKRVIARLRR